MFDTSLRADAGLGTPAKLDRRLTSMVVGASLFLLLMYTTLTVFVKETWAIHAFEIGIYTVVAAYLLLHLRERNASGSSVLDIWLVASSLVYLIPLWGVVQILSHTTASTFETREAVLHWGSLAGVFFLIQIAAQARSIRHHFLSAFLCFATLMAILCLADLNSANGSVLWLLPTGYPEVFATFPSHNNYAQFVELALPVALWRAMRKGLRSWWYALACGLLYASVIGAASRVGMVLCTAEVLAILGYGLVKRQKREKLLSAHGTLAVVVMIPVFASFFTAVVGWEKVVQRLHESDPYLVRREYLLSAVEMAKNRPLTGYGLGTFPEVYQQYAIKDFPFYANHAHNDWAEFAADGGIPFLLLVLMPFVVVVPAALRSPWAFGLFAIMLHACVDFPFPRPAVSAWMFALLGILYAVRKEGQEPVRLPKPEPQLCKARA